MNIAILGGRFDPPHLGHWWIALQTLEKRPDIDKLLLMTARQHQWKPAVATGEERLHMLSFFNHQKIEISDIELKRKGISYSIDTIDEIKHKTGASIYWIIGADIVSEFERWDRKDELVKRAKFLVFPRDPHEIPLSLPKGFEIIRYDNLITTNISSTIIRQRIKEKKTIKGFVLPEVEQYVKKKRLYR